jgi:hypothetical protein
MRTYMYVRTFVHASMLKAKTSKEKYRVHEFTERANSESRKARGMVGEAAGEKLSDEAVCVSEAFD